jgi:hypothetical protein
MAIGYTEHAKERMKHREISKSQIADTVLHPYFVIPSRLGRFIAVKKYGGKYLKVIYEKDKGKITVITVYWTRRP